MKILKMINLTKLFSISILSLLITSCSGRADLEPVHFSFIEEFNGGKANRFLIKNVDIEEQGNSILVRAGRTLTIQADIFHDCKECGNALNQIIIGFSKAEKAKACIWNGGPGEGKWERVEFKLEVPAKPGIYYLRSRYAQAKDCKDALNWWQIDRPGGPDHKSNIALIEVQ